MADITGRTFQSRSTGRVEPGWEDDDAEDDVEDDDAEDDAHAAEGVGGLLVKWRNLQIAKKQSLGIRPAMGR